MTELTRRQWAKQSVGGLIAIATFEPQSGFAAAPDKPTHPDGCTLSFGTYGTQGIPLQRAIRLIAATGFDGVEIAVQPDYGAAPTELSAEKRAEIRRVIEGEGLKLTALMEHLAPLKDDREHRVHVTRREHVAALAHALSPDAPPLVQTVLGGGDWETSKTLFRDRLADWLAVMQDAKITLAIKPHRGGAMSRPAEAVWLIEQLGNSRWLRIVYDYSHYAFRDMQLEETVRTALPYTAHVAVKDAVEQDGRVAFLLPGESGKFDYAELLRLLHRGGYRGDICCEVSGMVSKKAGYDPVAAMKTCYKNMAEAFVAAGVPRRS